jgi:predicted dehydrogenase
MNTIGVALIGCGQIALANHLPGIDLCSNARLVALCDNNSEVLAKAAQMTAGCLTSTRFEDIVTRSDVDAVIVATPNCMHAPIVQAAIRAGKHVLCEKPLAMNYFEALEMFHAAEAARVRHMTAFTYRFVPAMSFLLHQVKAGAIGQPYHFRAQRFQDWGARDLGWRQIGRLAGSGELGDMLSHRIDFAHLLIGTIDRVTAQTRRFIQNRQGRPSELEDWVAVLADFSAGATGVLESSKLCTGRGEGGLSRDYCEVNGSEGTLVYQLDRPNEVLIGRKGYSHLLTMPVPDDFLKWPGSPRDPQEGDPLVTFRYDQVFEFIDAIANERPCVPSFYDGCRVQAVMDATLESAATRQWVEVPAMK